MKDSNQNITSDEFTIKPFLFLYPLFTYLLIIFSSGGQKFFVGGQRFNIIQDPQMLFHVDQRLRPEASVSPFSVDVSKFSLCKKIICEVVGKVVST